jgi:hypothetical protein
MGVLRNRIATRFFDLVTFDYRGTYAHALMAGTYQCGPRCPKCKIATRARVAPLVIEWEAGSDIIADFTWPAGLGEIIVTDQVRSCFVSNGFTGVRFEPIQMVQGPAVRKPRNPSRARKRVWLPYSGPLLWSITVTSCCDMDLTASRREIVIECEHCNRNRMIVHDATAPLVVRNGSWDGAHFFRIREMGGLVFVLQDVMTVVQKSAFTNVRMKERGVVA